MKLVIRDEAVRDLKEIFDYIAKDNIAAAGSVVERLRERMAMLEMPELAGMGRRGRASGTREVIEAPYIIVYEADVGHGVVEVLSVAHTARNR